MTEASMLLEARKLARRKSCYALRCLLRLRGAPAIASFLLLLPAARAAAAAAAASSSTARVLVLREALRDSIAFQNALSLGSSSGALGTRRGGDAGRNRQHHSCPFLQRNEATKWVVASPRRAPVSLEDAAREEDVMGSPRVSGKDIGEENSDGSERRAAADDDGSSDAGEGGSSEGRAVVAADILVAMDDSLEARPHEGEISTVTAVRWCIQLHIFPLLQTATLLLLTVDRYSSSSTWTSIQYLVRNRQRESLAEIYRKKQRSGAVVLKLLQKINKYCTAAVR